MGKDYYKNLDEITVLRKKVKERGQTIQRLERCLTEREHMIDSLHYVWCTGGCKGGVHRFCGEPLKLETVELAERNAKRLRAKWNALEFRRKRDETN